MDLYYCTAACILTILYKDRVHTVAVWLSSAVVLYHFPIHTVLTRPDKFTVFCVITVFWFTFTWTFGGICLAIYIRGKWIIVEGEISNYFSFILDPFIQLWAWRQQVTVRYPKRPLNSEQCGPCQTEELYKNCTVWLWEDISIVWPCILSACRQMTDQNRAGSKRKFVIQLWQLTKCGRENRWGKERQGLNLKFK
jgi:hypothetical protein